MPSPRKVGTFFHGTSSYFLIKSLCKVDVTLPHFPCLRPLGITSHIPGGCSSTVSCGSHMCIREADGKTSGSQNWFPKPSGMCYRGAETLGRVSCLEDNARHQLLLSLCFFKVSRSYSFCHRRLELLFKFLSVPWTVPVFQITALWTLMLVILFVFTARKSCSTLSFFLLNATALYPACLLFCRYHSKIHLFTVRSALLFLAFPLLRV